MTCAQETTFSWVAGRTRPGTGAHGRGVPAPEPEPHREAVPAAPAEQPALVEITDSSPAGVLAVMRPVLDLMRESVGLPADMSTRGVSDRKRLDD